MPLKDRAERLAADRDRGASELLHDLLPLLADALADGDDAVRTVARAVCRGQPAMAPLWNACGAAISEADRPGRFAHVRAEMTRAAGALTRAASAELRALLRGDAAPRILTLSFSGSVAAALGAVARDLDLHVVCGEGRPRWEGRRMAETLGAAGATVTLTTDAAVTACLPGSAAVIVGADALAADFWINKVGTFGLSAAAAHEGVPVYVVASRDKALARALAERWSPPGGDPAEVWEQPPAGIQCVNPSFEATPSTLATLFLTDAGAVSPADLGALAERYGRDAASLLSCLG